VIVLEYLSEFIRGLGITAAASTLAFLGALVLGTLGALGRLSGSRVVRFVTRVYVEAFRNTPVLVQMFMIYFGLPAIGIYLPGFAAGTITLALNAGAYLTETIRTGIRAVPVGQLEAARTLALSRSQIFARIIAPQAFRTMYPPIVNEFVLIILTSSLISTIAVNDLTGVAMIVSSLTFASMESFGMAMLFYLLLPNAVAVLAQVFARVAFKAPMASTGSQGTVTRRSLLRPTRRAL
jgi:polar amino acid transport system permease protein